LRLYDRSKDRFANTPETWDMRELAWSLLQEANALWWEPAYGETILAGEKRPIAPLYCRIRIGRVTGHTASSEE
jgi:hypothetical protein